MPKSAQPSLPAEDRPASDGPAMPGASTEPILSERQWLWLSQRLPLATEKRGRPPRNNRAVIEGIVWVAVSGQPWRDLPRRFGKWSSVYRRFQRWHRCGVFSALMEHIRPFECGPRAPDAETRRLYECLVVIAPLAARTRTARKRTSDGSVGGLRI